MSQPGSPLSVASTFVLGGMEPLRLVVHHTDGSWDFLCNTTEDADFLVAVHAAEVFARFPTDLASVQTLPPGCLAVREEPGHDWTIESYHDGE